MPENMTRGEKILYWTLFLSCLCFVAAFILSTLIFCGIETKYLRNLFDLLYASIAAGLIVALVGAVLFSWFRLKK